MGLEVKNTFKADTVQLTILITGKVCGKKKESIVIKK